LHREQDAIFLTEDIVLDLRHIAGVIADELQRQIELAGGVANTHRVVDDVITDGVVEEIPVLSPRCNSTEKFSGSGMVALPSM
jgi:hypothetical protein